MSVTLLRLPLEGAGCMRVDPGVTGRYQYWIRRGGARMTRVSTGCE